MGIPSRAWLYSTNYKLIFPLQATDQNDMTTDKSQTFLFHKRSESIFLSKEKKISNQLAKHTT